MPHVQIEPFLRWVGGKQQILGRLLNFVPEDLEERTYREPFLGAGSLFFAVAPKMSHLSDANAALTSCFRQVKRYPSAVARHLASHSDADSKQHFYTTRDAYNSGSSSAAQAARFIYLNRTCFNGIYRVNRQGKFNVPYGYKAAPKIPLLEHLEQASGHLMNAELTCQSYEVALRYARAGDFIYLDPPYPPLNDTAYFTHYTRSRFGFQDQIELSCLVQALDKRGCLILMSNADTKHIRSLYRDLNLYTLPVTRFVTCKKERHSVSELIITNYDVRQDQLDPRCEPVMLTQPEKAGSSE